MCAIHMQPDPVSITHRSDGLDIIERTGGCRARGCDNRHHWCAAPLSRFNRERERIRVHAISSRGDSAQTRRAEAELTEGPGNLVVRMLAANYHRPFFTNSVGPR